MKRYGKGLIIVLVLMLTLSMTLVGCSNNKGTEEDKNIEKDNKTAEDKETVEFVDDSYIVDAAWVEENLNSEEVLILDARGEEAYNKGHIPGAIAVTWQGFANVDGAPGERGWGVVLEPAALSEKLSAVGVDENKTVVVYADTKSGWGDDGRIVWMLRMAGLENSKMLDGGWNYWESQGKEITKEAVIPEPSEVTITKLDESWTIDTDTLKEKINDVVILDSRETDEYEGATNFGEKRGGYLPGTKHLNFQNLLNSDGTFKSPAEMQAVFEEAGIEKDDEIVTYCTAGIRSAHLSLTLRMMGYENAKNYDESFYTWAGDESLEIVK